MYPEVGCYVLATTWYSLVVSCNDYYPRGGGGVGKVVAICIIAGNNLRYDTVAYAGGHNWGHVGLVWAGMLC